MAKILSVSYDETLLVTRHKILESRGYEVTSALGIRDAVQQCSSDTPFDLFILGHSIPHEEKEALIYHFRANRPSTPVVALKKIGEERVRGADVVIEPNPYELLDAAVKLISSEQH